MKNALLYKEPQCNLIEVSQRFTGSSCLHLTRPYTSTRTHRFTSRKIRTFLMNVFLKAMQTHQKSNKIFNSLIIRIIPSRNFVCVWTVL